MVQFQTVISLMGLRKVSNQGNEGPSKRKSAIMPAAAFVRCLTFRATRSVVLLAMSILCLSALPTWAQDSSDIAKQAQNPIASLISVPFENDFNPHTGANKEDSYVFEMKPVVPFRLSNDWNLITRTIIPVIQVPDLAPGVSGTSGLGDIQESLFLSPTKAGPVIWGAGPVISFPTATEKILGTKKLSLGPTVVVLRSQGHWLFGSLSAKLILGGWTVGTTRREPNAAPTIRELQLAPQVVSDLVTDYYCKLGSKIQRTLGGACWRRRRKDRASREAASKCLYPILSQRTAPGWHQQLVGKIQHDVSFSKEAMREALQVEKR